MWPSTWIFDCCACLPDPYRWPTLSASLFSAFFSPSSHFRNFPWAFLNTEAKARLFSSVFPQTSLPKHPHLKTSFRNPPSAAPVRPGTAWSLRDVACTWSLTFWPLLSPSWPLNSPPIMGPFPLMNLLPRESQETGSCDPVVCAAMERPITAVTWQVTGTDGTMWALFSDKFLLPRGRDHSTGHACTIWEYRPGLQERFPEQSHPFSPKKETKTFLSRVKNQDPRLFYRIHFSRELKMIGSFCDTDQQNNVSELFK